RRHPDDIEVQALFARALRQNSAARLVRGAQDSVEGVIERLAALDERAHGEPIVRAEYAGAVFSILPLSIGLWGLEKSIDLYERVAHFLRGRPVEGDLRRSQAEAIRSLLLPLGMTRGVEEASRLYDDLMALCETAPDDVDLRLLRVAVTEG